MSDLYKDIFGISEQLIVSRDYKKILETIVKRLSKMTGASRTCVMIEKSDGKFVIKAGYPAGAHGINLILNPESGEEFLRAVLSEGEIVTVEDPQNDERTAYMQELAYKYELTKIIFVPLSYHGEELGVLVLDFCKNGEGLKVHLDHVKMLANLAAAAIGSEYERRRTNEKMRRMERLNAIGEEASRISHIFKNSLQMVGGFADRAYRKAVEQCSKEGDAVTEALGTVIEETRRLERIVNGILRFSNPGTLVLEGVLINELVRKTVDQATGETASEASFDETLDVFRLNVDIDRVAHAIRDVVINATQAPGATKIWARTKFASKRGVVLVEIGNNGEKIELGMVDDIFSPFITTKSSGTGLGLANVKSIMAAHGGDVRLVKNETGDVVFELSLLL